MNTAILVEFSTVARACWEHFSNKKNINNFLKDLRYTILSYFSYYSSVGEKETPIDPEELP
jgi:hypothetical protein